MVDTPANPSSVVPSQPPTPVDVSAPHTPLADQTEVSVSPPVGVVPPDSPAPRRKAPLKILVILLAVVLLLGVAAVGTAFAVAYDKLSLSNPKLEKTITKIVMDLPFMPKSAEYVLVAASLAQTKVTKQSFDVSVSVKTSNSQETLGFGLSSIDIESKGSIDYADPKNVKADLNLSITKDFNVDLKKNDTVLYFKLNTVPTTLLTLMGMDTTKLGPILENWVYYDTKTLETQASKYLEDSKKIPGLTYEEIDQEVGEFMDEAALKQLVLTSDTLDGHAVHKLHFAPTPELIDKWYEKLMEEAQKNSSTRDYYQFSEKDAFKLSDLVHDVVSDTWVDKKTHFVRKNVVAFKVKSNSPAGASLLPGAMFPLGAGADSDMSVAMVAQFDKFGEAFTVDTPETSVSTEEFIRMIQSTFVPPSASASADVQGVTTLQDVLGPLTP